MAELPGDKKLIEEVYAEGDGSDADSLDSEGYDTNDPYAAMAKRIDKRKKVLDEINNAPMGKLTNAIIGNRANMSYFEKHTMKYVVLVGLLGLLIYSNLTNAPKTGGPRSAELSREEH